MKTTSEVKSIFLEKHIFVEIDILGAFERPFSVNKYGLNPPKVLFQFVFWKKNSKTPQSDHDSVWNFFKVVLFGKLEF